MINRLPGAVRSTKQRRNPMKTNKQPWATAMTLGSVAAVTMSLTAACGDSFSGDDNCKTRHTCPPPSAGDGSGAAAGADTNAGGAPGGGGGGSDEADAGSGEATAECAADDDCDNGNATDGKEACFGGQCVPGNAPPTIVSVTPSEDAVDVEPDGTIVIEASEALDEATITAETVKIMDGDVEVGGELSYADAKITFTPDRPLALLAAYEVSVTTGLKDEGGAALSESFTSKFKVRDGAWSVATVKEGDFGALSTRLDVDAEGRALLGWTDGAEGACPARAAFFQRGEALTAKELTFSRTQYCSAPRAALSANGYGFVSWYEEDNQGNGLATAEYRDGKWGAASGRNNRNDSFSGAVGAAEDGTLHYIGPGSGDVQVWFTSPEGKWAKNGVILSPRVALGDVQLSVAKNGDAVAAWRDEAPGGTPQILVATYSAQAKVWSPGITLPGSLSSSEEHGEPQTVFDADNVPAVMWLRGEELVVSRFVPLQGSWSGPVKVSGSYNVFPHTKLDAPAIVFDGTSLVVAFTAFNGAVSKRYDVYVSRYDRDIDEWASPEVVSSNDTVAAFRMPRMVADARGNLLVVWASTATPVGTFELAYQRYDAEAGAWAEAAFIDDATFTNADLTKGDGYFPLGGNQDGLAALAFADKSSSWLANLRLASFH